MPDPGKPDAAHGTRPVAARHPACAEIERLMAVNGLSTKGLAALAEVSHGWLRSLLAGEVMPEGASELAAVAGALGRSLQLLVSAEPQPGAAPQQSSPRVDFAKLDAEVAEHMEAVGRERDLLDDLVSTVQGLRDDCSEAYDALQNARDALSRLV